jgi:regulatory protein
MLKKKKLKQDAYREMCRYCASQERSYRQVRDKLRKLGYAGSDAEEILSELIAEGFVNEERFARAFASGKHKINRWGKAKIGLELRRKGLSPRNIEIALDSIDPDEYEQTALELILKKLDSLDRSAVSRNKIYRYMVRKGFESALVIALLDRES